MTQLVINGTKLDTTEDLIAYRPNPKRQGKKAWARYEAYQEVTTLDEYFEVMSEYEQDGQPLKRAVMLADLRYDLEKGHLYIVEDVEEEAEPELKEEIQFGDVAAVDTE